MKLLTHIAKFAQETPQHIALWVDQHKISYEALWLEAQRQSEKLPSDCQNQRIAIAFHDIQSCMMAYIAIHIKDGIPCVFDPTWSAERQHFLCERYDITMIWNDTGLQYIQDVQTHVASPPQLLYIGFTSGTTGDPKAFYRDEPSWIASYEENEALMSNMSQHATMVALGPYAHSLTLYVIVYALFYGRTFVGENEYSIERVVDKIDEMQSPCALFLVPTMIYDWIRHYQKSNLIHYVFVSGDKLSVQLHQQMKVLLPAAMIYEFFGTSEASFISVNRDQQEPLASVGRRFPPVNVHIAHPDEEGIGELYIQSPMIFSGYVGEMKPDWIQTGDYASMRDDILYLHGRLQDMMIIGGKNIYPLTVEYNLKKLTEIEEVVVVREKHHKFGEIAIALYIGQELSYREMRSQLQRYVTRYEIPSKLIQVTTLPYTASGKVSRREAQQLFDKGEYDG